MNTQALTNALVHLKAERQGVGRVLEREHPALAHAIDEVLRVWRASTR